MYKVLLVLCLAINVSYASGVKLIDYIVSGSGITQILAKQGIVGDDAQQIKSYVQSSLKALSNKGEIVTKQDLIDVLSKLPVTGQDANVRKSLQILLDTPDDKILKKDVIGAINNLISLSRYNVFVCSGCANDNLAKHGIIFSVKAITNSSYAKLISDVIPKDPTQRSQFIANRMKKLNLGDYAKAGPKNVLPEDEQQLGLFVAIAENGTPQQKALIASILKVSTVNGKTNIVDPKNPHKLWTIFAPDKEMSGEDMAEWSKLLDKVAGRMSKDNISSTEEAFYRTLKDEAAGDERKMKLYEDLKAMRCFF